MICWTLSTMSFVAFQSAFIARTLDYMICVGSETGIIMLFSRPQARSLPHLFVH